MQDNLILYLYNKLNLIVEKDVSSANARKNQCQNGSYLFFLLAKVRTIFKTELFCP